MIKSSFEILLEKGSNGVESRVCSVNKVINERLRTSLSSLNVCNKHSRTINPVTSSLFDRTFKKCLSNQSSPSNKKAYDQNFIFKLSSAFNYGPSLMTTKETFYFLHKNVNNGKEMFL